MRIQSSQAHNLFKNIGQEMDKATRRGLISAAQQSRKLVIDRTRHSEGAFDTGNFIRSWKVAVGSVGEAVARLFNDAQYAGVIEYGRRPGKGVPLEALYGWVLRHNAGLRRQAKAAATKRRKRLGSRRQVFSSEVRSIAYLISRAIKQRGMPGHFILKNALPEIRRITQSSVALEVAKAMSRLKGGGAA